VTALVTTEPGPDAWARSHVANEPRDSDDPLGTLEWLQLLCRAAARAVPAGGVAVSLTTDDGERALAAASDATAADADELQFTLGEGPCREAFSSSRPVLVPDLSEASSIGRWPGYATDVQDRGVHAVFALPMQVGAARLGALSVHFSEPTVLSAEGLGRILAFVGLPGPGHGDGATRGRPGRGHGSLTCPRVRRWLGASVTWPAT